MSGPQIVVAGSGKMARDVGAYFLGKGHSVAWLSRDRERLAKLERMMTKRARRLAELRREEGDTAEVGEPSFFIVGDVELPQAEVFIECINEAEEEKRALLRELDGLIPDDAIRVSNSSSIFPDALHEDCAGLHFFYPVELTGFVEAVFPKGFSQERRRRLLDLLSRTQLECIEEEDTTAFAVNRLLLPVQAESLRLVMAGGSAQEVNDASISSALPIGQLALMDTIGLDVVHPAVRNFMERMTPPVSGQYQPLRDGLARLLELGKRGRKNRNGFLVGDPLPWSVPSDHEPEPIAPRLQSLFINTCYHALEHHLLTEEQLALALGSLFDWSGSLAEAVAPLGFEEAALTLVRAYDDTGLPYFIPARPFRDVLDDVRDWPEHGPMI